jgi:hypothetical protein
VIRRMLAMIAMLAAVAGIASVAAAPSQEQLSAAMLTAADIGEGFTVLQSGPVEQLTSKGVANHLTVFSRTLGVARPSFTIVIDALTDSATLEGLPATDPTEQLQALKQFGVTVQQVEAPAIGQNTVKLALSGSVFGLALSGDCIIWQHAGVSAAVCALGEGNPTATDFAMQQHQRLIAVFGE